MKSALLSAFVFPGTGHFYLKRHITGAVLAGTAFIALYFMITTALERAQQIVDKIQSGEIQPDIAVITELVAKQPTGTDAQLTTIATAVLIIAWLVGVVDAYRIGRVQDGRAVADDK
jgi:ABC-type glycerol-3-phosphate transport system permease component